MVVKWVMVKGLIYNMLYNNIIIIITIIIIYLYKITNNLGKVTKSFRCGMKFCKTWIWWVGCDEWCRECYGSVCGGYWIPFLSFFGNSIHKLAPTNFTALKQISPHNNCYLVNLHKTPKHRIFEAIFVKFCKTSKSLKIGAVLW